MLELILATALFGGCSGGTCTAEKAVAKTRIVSVTSDVQPVRKVIKRVRASEVFKHRFLRRR